MLCEPCRVHFNTFLQLLDERDIKYTISRRLVRGLDYYKRTTFELTGEQLGAQNTIVGGGRYDGLSEMLGGPPAKGFGFAFGVERMVMSLPEGSFDPSKEAPKLYIAYIGDEARKHAFALGRRMRESGISTIVDLEGRKLKKSLAVANSLAARFTVIIGEDEIKSGAYTLRDMTTGEQRTLNESDLISTLSMFD